VKRSILLMAPATLLVASLAAWALLTPVHPSRGIDELDLYDVRPIPLQAASDLTQQIEIQRPHPSAIRFPYRWLDSRPALVRVTLLTENGETLQQTVERLPDSAAPRWLRPVSNGATFESLRATYHELPLPAGAQGRLLLRLSRVDTYGSELDLFVGPVPGPYLISHRGSPAQTRQPLLEQSGLLLDFQTFYGDREPAWRKAGDYATRLNSLAPPWLPGPLPEVLLVAFLVAGGLLLGGALSPMPANADE
jgi:hypothetical protein